MMVIDVDVDNWASEMLVQWLCVEVICVDGIPQQVAATQQLNGSNAQSIATHASMQMWTPAFERIWHDG